MKELVRPGENGELVGFDVASLAAGLRRALRDEPRRRRMGADAVRAAARFEYAATIRGYASGLPQLAGEPPP